MQARTSASCFPVTSPPGMAPPPTSIWPFAWASEIVSP